jgi:hypothetical protein
MTYRVKITSVKAPEVQWFSDANPASFAAYTAWAATLPGIISVNKQKLNANTVIKTYVFNDQAAYDNSVAEHAANVDSQLRQAYNELNNIVSTTELLND